MATVVLLHGIADDSTCWPTLTPLLQRDGHRVLSLDSPGHGGRDVGIGQSLRVADLADDVERTLQERDVTRAIVIGHSLGASTAAVLAAQAPGRVAALVLEDPPWEEAERGRHGVDVAELQTWIAGLAASSVDDRAGWARHHHPQWPDAEFGPWARAKARISPEVFTCEHDWLQSAWRPVIDAVSCPTLMLVGQHQWGSQTCAEARERADDVGWQVFEAAGAGHSIRREAPGWYAAHVRAVARTFS